MKILLSLMILIPGPTLYIIYNYLNINLTLFPQRINISIVISTFSFTMLGFLAAIITILFSLTNTTAFKKYQRIGYLDVLLFAYFISILNFIATFILSILSFSKTCSPLLFNFMIMSLMNNVFQIFLLSIIILNLFKKASQEQ